jgi:hypothetical protein
MQKLKYRRARASDSFNLWRLKNDEVVRQNAINKEVILWPDHCRWFESVLKSSHTKIWIIETMRGHFIGDVRIQGAEISIRLSANYRGMGIGGRAIAKFSAVGQIAQILEHNGASMTVFLDNGFKIVSFENGIYTLKK